jgi:acyl carrier protein
MEKDDKKFKKYLEITRKVLSQILGTDFIDIQLEDSFTEDLHMGPSELADFIQLMNEKGFSLDDLDLEEIGTVEEFVDYLVNNEEV